MITRVRSFYSQELIQLENNINKFLSQNAVFLKKITYQHTATRDELGQYDCFSAMVVYSICEEP